MVPLGVVMTDHCTIPESSARPSVALGCCDVLAKK